MDEHSSKFLVLAVTAFLIVSLTINVLLASGPDAFSSPPLRVNGFITDQGEPAPGYYYAPGQVPPTRSFFVPADDLR